MAAASMAIARGSSNDGGMHSLLGRIEGKGAAHRQPCTLQLPPESEWMKSGLLYKNVPGHTCPWQPRRVVLTADSICVTRQESNHVVERFELHTLQAISPHTPVDDDSAHPGKGRKMSAATVETVLKRQSTLRTREQKATSGDNAEESTPDKPAFLFKTVDEQGHKRRFCFGASTQGEVQEWMEALKIAVKKADERARKQDHWGYLERRLKKVYDSVWAQSIIASLIIGNFAVAIVKAQLVPPVGSSTDDIFNNVEILFTACFVIDLVVNMLANFFWAFWKDWWNILDFFVVIVSLIAIPMSNVAGFNILRMMRVFRVVRVFNSLKSLKTIINALTSAIVPVANAFAVLAVATAIYAVIGVSLYGEMDPVQFGTFKRATFSMFQVITGDGWATTMARPLFDEDQDPNSSVTLFFASYILIVGTFLLNVVVAVLLDEFISSVQIGKAEARRKNLNSKKTSNTLDPLIMSFGTCEDSQALSAMIKAVYQVLDADDSGGLSFAEFRDGLPRLDTTPTIYLAPEDFDEITEGGTLCDLQGELDLNGFEILIRRQLKAYTQRRATFEMIEADSSNSTVSAVLLMTKQVMMDLEAMQRKVDSLSSDSSGKGQSPLGPITSPKRGGATPGGPGPSPLAPLRHPREESGSDKSETAAKDRGGEPSAGKGEACSCPIETIYRMDKKLSRIYSKLYSVHDVVTEGGGSGRGRQNGSGEGRGKSREKQESPHGAGRSESQDRGARNGGRRSESPDRGARNGGRRGSAGTDRGLWDDEESGRGAKRRGGAGRKPSGREAENLEAYEMPSSPGLALEARLERMEKKIEDMVRDQMKALTTRLERKIDGWTRPQRRGSAVTADAGMGPYGGSFKDEERAMTEVEGFIGGAASQLMLGGMANSQKSPKASNRARRGSAMLTKMLTPKNRRESLSQDSFDNMVTGELTFEPKGKRFEDGARRGNDARMPSFMVKGAGQPVAVRVSWLSSPALSPALAEPPEEVACEGCHRCYNGYVGVGCLVCGEKIVMVANTEDLLGNELQSAGPDVLAVMGQGLLRRHGHTTKAIDPSKFVDTPHGDGRHWFRCYLLLGRDLPLPEPPGVPQDEVPTPTAGRNRRGSFVGRRGND